MLRFLPLQQQLQQQLLLIVVLVVVLLVVLNGHDRHTHNFVVSGFTFQVVNNNNNNNNNNNPIQSSKVFPFSTNIRHNTGCFRRNRNLRSLLLRYSTNNNNNNNDNNNDNAHCYKNENDNTSMITIMDGPFEPSQLSNVWGRRPLLVRKAFSNPNLYKDNNNHDNEVHDEKEKEEEESVWPTWDQLMSWASSTNDRGNNSNDYDDHDEAWMDDDNDDDNDDDDEVMPIMSRLIRKENERMDSFSLELGPFSKSYLDALVVTSTTKANTNNSDNNDASKTWSLILNDVDRIHLPLADWMQEIFGSFLPSWRIDDGQISMAPVGGGIGPHVDNYDVFLIQTSGQRQWLLLNDVISTQQEMDALREGLEVRILDLEQLATTTTNNSNNTVVVKMNEGDMLYLPPRIVHWGTSQSDDCMTLSVGCRAPSATELVSKVAEHLAYSTAPKAVQRYTDIDLLSNSSSSTACGSITSQVKNDLKQLVLEAVHDVLDNPVLWDEIVGEILTAPKRPVDLYESYNGMNVDNHDGNDNGRYYSPREHLQMALENGIGALYPTEGVSFATSVVPTNDGGSWVLYRIFADGQKFEWKGVEADPFGIAVLNAMEIKCRLDKDWMDSHSQQLPDSTMLMLEELLRRGVLYYFDEDQD